MGSKAPKPPPGEPGYTGPPQRRPDPPPPPPRGRSKNRFDVQVVFPDFTFGITHRPDVELTPDDVATALEEFCARIRSVAKQPPAADASDPHAANPGKLTTRARKVSS